MSHIPTLTSEFINYFCTHARPYCPEEIKEMLMSCWSLNPLVSFVLPIWDALIWSGGSIVESVVKAFSVFCHLTFSNCHKDIHSCHMYKPHCCLYDKAPSCIV